MVTAGAEPSKFVTCIDAVEEASVTPDEARGVCRNAPGVPWSSGAHETATPAKAGRAMPHGYRRAPRVYAGEAAEWTLTEGACMFQFRTLRHAAFAGAAVLALGCSDGQSPEGTTQFSVLLKDAPGDVHAAVVTIDEVQLVGDGGKLTLTDAPMTVDLLTLANVTAALVEDAEVPSGTYTELRFIISGAYIEVENEDASTSIYASSPSYEGLPDGATVDGQLQMPSFAESGLKVTLASGALTLTGDQKVLLVDFDVQQSFGHVAGQSGMWVMHPVITGGEIKATGTVQASVELGEDVTLPEGTTLADFSVTLTNTATATSTTVALADDDSDGVFEVSFVYVVPGSYEVSLELPASVSSVTTDPAVPVAVSVTSGEGATVALTITGVTAAS